MLSVSSLVVRGSPSTHRSRSWCDGSVVVIIGAQLASAPLDADDKAVFAIVVVPCTTTRRGWSEVGIVGFGVDQAHLPTTIGVDRIVDATGTNIGPVALQRIRELVADLIGL